MPSPTEIHCKWQLAVLPASGTRRDEGGKMSGPNGSRIKMELKPGDWSKVTTTGPDVNHG